MVLALEAQDKFNKLTDNGAIILSDAAVKATKLFDEDLRWVKTKLDEGYMFIDIGATKESVWYKAESEVLGWK